MKAPKEIRKWVSSLRKHCGKKNGVIPAYCFDSYEMECKSGKNKRINKRHEKHRKKEEIWTER